MIDGRVYKLLFHFRRLTLDRDNDDTSQISVVRHIKFVNSNKPHAIYVHVFKCVDTFICISSNGRVLP